MKQELVLMLTGDICFGLEEYPLVEGLLPPDPKKKPDLERWLEKVAPILQQSDFAIGVLEGTICDKVADAGRSSWGVVIRMPPRCADEIKNAGFHALALATNHTMDFGPKGMSNTLKNLKRVGLKYAGGGLNFKEAHQPAVLKKDDVTVALLSYSSVFIPGLFPAGENKPGISTVAVSTQYEVPDRINYSPGLMPRIITVAKKKDVETMIKDVQRSKKQFDIVVVSWHWGVPRDSNSRSSGIPVEDVPLCVQNYQEEMAHTAINAGADLVFGHHPHRLLGMEIYKNKLICYGLPHLTFGYWYSAPVFQEESLIVKAYIDKYDRNITRIGLIPIYQPSDTHQTYLLSICEAENIIQQLEKESLKYGTRFEIKNDEIVIYQPS